MYSTHAVRGIQRGAWICNGGKHIMQKTIARGLFYGLATILVLWTDSLTYTFVSAALPQTHWLAPFFALVVFDVGMLAWLKVFLDRLR